MVTHARKILRTHFEARINGCKDWELRQEDDARFEVGDFLVLREWDPATEAYTGAEEVARITHVVRDVPGLAPGYALLSTETVWVHQAPPIKFRVDADDKASPVIAQVARAVAESVVPATLVDSHVEASKRPGYLDMVTGEHLDQPHPEHESLHLNEILLTINKLRRRVEFLENAGGPDAAHGWLCIDAHEHLSGRVLHEMPDEDGPEFVSTAEAARIVREHNERKAREEQGNPFEDVAYKPEPFGFIGRRLAELDIRTKNLEERTDWIREMQERPDDEPAGILPPVIEAPYARVCACQAEEGDEYYLNGRWWKSGGGSAHPRDPFVFHWRRKTIASRLPGAEGLAELVRGVQDGPGLEIYVNQPDPGRPA